MYKYIHIYYFVCFSLFFDEGRADLASTIFRMLKPEVILGFFYFSFSDQHVGVIFVLCVI